MKGEETGTFVTKKRTRSVHSVLSPPKNALKWTIASECNSTSQPLTVALSGGSSSAQSSELFPESESGHTPASSSVSTRYRDDCPSQGRHKGLLLMLLHIVQDHEETC